MRGLSSEYLKMIQKAVFLIHNGNDKAASLIDDIYLLANDMNDELLLLWHTYLSGYYSIYRGEYAKAHDLLDAALMTAKSMKVLDLEIKISTRLGDLHHRIDDFNGALDYYLYCLELDANVFYDIDGKSGILSHIGDIYLALEQYSIATEYYNEALTLCISQEDTSSVLYLKMKLAQVYLDNGQLELAHSTINQYFTKALEGSLEVEMARGYEQYANYYWAIMDYKEARVFFEKAKKKMAYLEMHEELCGLIADYGRFLYESNQKNDALEILSEATLLLLDKTSDAELTVYLYMAKIYEDRNLHQKAYTYFKRYHELKSMKDETWKTIKIRNIVNKYEYLHSDVKVKALEVTNENLQIISAVGRDITGKLNLTDVLQKMGEYIYQLFDTKRFVVGTLEDKNTMNMMVHNGIKRTECQVKNGNQKSYAFDLLADIVVNNDFSIKELESHLYKVDRVVFDHVLSFMSIPLVYDDKNIGVLMIQQTDINGFREEHIEMLKILSSYVSIAIRNSAQSKELIETNQKLKDLTERDGLTKVYNRYALNKNMKRVIKKAYTYDNPFAIVMIDVDFFKEYNDNYGHQAGDQALIKVSKALMKVIEPLKHQHTYNVFRYGGDEFAMILTDIPEVDMINIAETIRNEVLGLNIEHKFSKVAKVVTLTIGLAIVMRQSEDLEGLFAEADKALYMAKRQGRNNVKTVVVD